MKKQSLAVPIILTIITAGLYGFIYLIWFQLKVSDQDTSAIEVGKVFLGTIFLSAITAGIWFLFVLWRTGGNMSEFTNTKSRFMTILTGLFGLFGIYGVYKVNKHIDGMNKEY